MKNWYVRTFLSMLLMQSKNNSDIELLRALHSCKRNYELGTLISGKQNITVWPLHSLVSICMKTRLCNLLQQKLKSIAKTLDKTI